MNNTLIKGLRLLEVLVARAQPVGISELAQELEMGASNVHRLLQALVELGYAVNEGGRRRCTNWISVKPQRRPCACCWRKPTKRCICRCSVATR